MGALFEVHHFAAARRVENLELKIEDTAAGLDDFDGSRHCTRILNDERRRGRKRARRRQQNTNCYENGNQSARCRRAARKILAALIINGAPAERRSRFSDSAFSRFWSPANAVAHTPLRTGDEFPPLSRRQFFNRARYLVTDTARISRREGIRGWRDFLRRVSLDGYISFISRHLARKSRCKPGNFGFRLCEAHRASIKFMKPLATRVPRPKIYVPRRGIMRRN